MSALSEYLKLIPLGLKNPKEVLQGFMNKLNLENLSQDVKEEIARRRLICAQCPFMSENAKLIANFKTERSESFCTLCSCPIKTKTASLISACGAKTYNERHPDNEQEVKWLPYDSKG